MTEKYRKAINYLGEEVPNVIIRVVDDALIPFDPANSDYQRYLRWLENPEAEENGTISQNYAHKTGRTSNDHRGCFLL